MSVKRCVLCQGMFSLSAFYKNRTQSDGYEKFCKTCEADRKRRYRKENILVKQRENIYALNRHYVNSYGLTLTEVEDLKNDQDYRCAICGIKRRLVVDHDHTTGKTRELLCYRCNSYLGMIGDDIAVLEEAIAYLKRHGDGVESDRAVEA